MTSDEFKKAVIQEPLGTFSSRILLERTPFIFNENRDLFFKWKHTLADELKIDSSCIVFTGSSSVGISLNPRKNLKSFDSASDIDLAIISDYFFTTSWRALRNMGAEFHGLNPKMKVAVRDHRERLIYFGTIATDKILPLLPFHKEWAAAAAKMQNQEPTLGRTINFRIYKDFESLRAYHIDNLNKIKTSLLTGTEDGI